MFTEEYTKLNYQEPIQQQPLQLSEKKITKKKFSIPDDEG